MKRDEVSAKARKRRLGLGLLLTIGAVFGSWEVFMLSANASARASCPGRGRESGLGGPDAPGDVPLVD